MCVFCFSEKKGFVTTTNEGKPQMKKKTQMTKTNVENFKEVTHETMLFSDLVLLTIIICVNWL